MTLNGSNLAWITAALAIISPLATVAALKVFPDLFAKALMEGVEQRNRRQLTKYKSDLDRSSSLALESARASLAADYGTLKASMDYLSASHSGLRAHSVDAVKTLWRDVLALKAAMAGLWTFEQILTDDEKQDVVSGKDRRGRDYITPFLTEATYHAYVTPLLSSDAESHRPFCGERLWLMFVIYRNVHLRSAFLTQQAVEKRRHKRLSDDTGINQLLSAVLTPKAIAEARKQPFNDINSLLAQIEGMFLQEAARVMSGSNAVAESLADMQATLLLHTKAMRPNRDELPEPT